MLLGIPEHYFQHPLPAPIIWAPIQMNSMAVTIASHRIRERDLPRSNSCPPHLPSVALYNLQLCRHRQRKADIKTKPLT